MKKLLWYGVGGWVATWGVQWIGGGGMFAFIAGMVAPGILLLAYIAYRIKTQEDRTRQRYWSEKRP